jgi:hypothetical protein
MQEKKNKRLVILFAALCSMTAIVYWLGQEDGTVSVDKNKFKGFDLKAIDHVILESKGGRVELKFTGSKWEVNNQFDADASMIQVLFATLQQAEPKRPVAESMRDSVNEALKVQGVKVTLMEAGAEKSSFYAGGNGKKTQAIFAEAGDEMTPYLVVIPGYRVYVSGIFEVPEKDWKNKYVFGFNWRNFERLESEFPQKPSDGFQVALQDNFFAVQGLLNLDTGKLNSYLDDVSLLTVDEYKDDPIFTDSLTKPLPMAVIIVKDIAQRAYKLELYPPRAIGQPVPALINGVQWAFISPEKVQKIIKRKAFFEK